MRKNEILINGVWAEVDRFSFDRHKGKKRVSNVTPRTWLQVLEDRAKAEQEAQKNSISKESHNAN